MVIVHVVIDVVLRCVTQAVRCVTQAMRCALRGCCCVVRDGGSAFPLTFLLLICLQGAYLFFSLLFHHSA